MSNSDLYNEIRLCVKNETMLYWNAVWRSNVDFVAVGEWETTHFLIDQGKHFWFWNTVQEGDKRKKKREVWLEHPKREQGTGKYIFLRRPRHRAWFQSLTLFCFVLCIQGIMILIKGLGQAPSVVNENISTACSSSSTFSASRDSCLFINRLLLD